MCPMRPHDASSPEPGHRIKRLPGEKGFRLVFHGMDMSDHVLLLFDKKRKEVDVFLDSYF